MMRTYVTNGKRALGMVVMAAALTMCGCDRGEDAVAQNIAEYVSIGKRKGERIGK